MKCHCITEKKNKCFNLFTVITRDYYNQQKTCAPVTTFALVIRGCTG